ncbi:MAG: uncharacterized protein A8A55_3054 [Amphiamblys sp. WSBS2006]|nr:MAG: uncharacterized protein A8A55_3054 [Amphiamblys sp. WSBS2006]
MKRLLKGKAWEGHTPVSTRDRIWKQEDKTKAFERFKNLGLGPERGAVVTLSGLHPEWGLGWRMVLRLLCGYLWTGPRLAKAKLKDEILSSECPGCGGPAEDELHWTFFCPAWEDGRVLADKAVVLAQGERPVSHLANPIDLVNGKMSTEARTKGYKWLAAFF